jgi:hypothetical protein
MMAGEVARTSDGAISGRVIPPRSGPRTEYVYVQNRGTNAAGQRRTLTYTPQRGKQYGGVPVFLSNREVIFMAWLIAMILIGFDEWHNHGILPRPQRLWYTSLTYGILALVSGIDAVVPIANAFALGFTLVLLYQYYQKTGQFGSATDATGTTQAPGTTTAGGRG